jgi:hypothetical protein
LKRHRSSQLAVAIAMQAGLNTRLSGYEREVIARAKTVMVRNLQVAEFSMLKKRLNNFEPGRPLR